ncbi:MAG: insulinase family protein [Muribaculaceae bacterium]|nr:insulinase family protein [Muribaculaceae bacterium]
MDRKLFDVTMQPAPTTIKLPSGLQLVHIHYPTAGAGIFGIAVKAGSANESSDEYGLAHLVEHTLFKGTKKRSSWHIINRMEAVGGELNAFTTKEDTVVYSIFPAGNANRAIELIADLATNSQFPDREIDKEREVVIDEINSYRDTPAEAIFDEFEEFALASTPLSHNILGSPDSVRLLNSSHCRQFLADNYTVDNVVVFYSGSDSIDKIARLAERYFAAMPSVGKRFQMTATPKVDAFDKTITLDVHQTHALIGACVGGIFSPQRYAISLFSNITGGPGMNSLLNVELRERRGLVYSVETSTALFSTCGLITLYFGCDAHDLARCRKLCNNVFRHLAEGGLSERALASAKKQYMGQFAIASENRETRIMSAARSLLFRGLTDSYAETLRGINEVSLSDIADIAQRMCNASSLIYTYDNYSAKNS